MDRELEKVKARKRRNHKFRMRKRAREFFEWSRWWEYLKDEDLEEAKHLKACMWADNMAKCSCDMCGNVRRQKWSKKERYTQQEHKFFDIVRMQLEEISECGGITYCGYRQYSLTTPYSLG